MTSRIVLATSIIIISLLFIVATFFYFLLKVHREWKTKVKSSPVDRNFSTKQSFIDHFVKKGYSSKSTEFVYQKTQIFLRAKDIVLLPQDDLIELYERQKDEWFYIINKWFTEIGKPSLDEKRLDDLLEKHKVLNFDFLIGLFDNQRH